MLRGVFNANQRSMLPILAVVAIWNVVQTIAAPLNGDPNASVRETGDVAAVEEGDSLLDDKAFSHGFSAAFAMMIVSEIGDKTFFIAAIMAMRHNRFTIFLGAISALGVMTVLSVYVGRIATFIPRVYTHYASSLLFLLAGLKLLHEGYGMAPDEGQEELEEVTLELKKKEEENAANVNRSCISPVYIQAFTMTFLAEWGDRSQIATIVLGTREDPLGVSIGGTLGHACCTCMAVLGGRLLAQKISVKTVTMVGGFTFLAFALTTLMLDDVEWE